LTDGPVSTLVLADTAQPVAVHLSPPEHTADGIRQWAWEPGKAWPAVQPPEPRDTAQTPTPPTNRKEQVTHG
jgi:hypothetical protein